MSYAYPAYSLAEDRPSHDDHYQPAYQQPPSFVERGPANWELSVDERIGRAPRGGTARRLRRALLLAALAGGGWAWSEDRLPTLPPWLTAEASSLASSVEQSVRAAWSKRLSAGPTEERAAERTKVTPADRIDAATRTDAGTPDPSLAAAPAPPLPPPRSPSPAPSQIQTAVAAPSVAAAAGDAATAIVAMAGPSQSPAKGPIAGKLDAAAKTSSAASAQPYMPAVAQSTDPLQKRAEKVGLHPDISRALLERLSAVDYRNAQAAIRAALSRTPENGVLVWPRQRGPGAAVFEVRFVSGAAPDCRRYVVTVLKDRWATTSPPVEKCGTAVRATRS